MSGLMMSGAVGFSPRDEKNVVDGAALNLLTSPVRICAVGDGCDAMYALICTPSVLFTCTAGSQWVSVNRLSESVLL